MFEDPAQLRGVDASESPAVVAIQPLLFKLADMVTGEVDFPGQVLVEKLEDHVVEAPEIVATAQVLVAMCVQRGVGHSASELSSFALLLDGPFHVKMLLRETKIHDVEETLGAAPAQHEVALAVEVEAYRLDVSMEVAFLMHRANGEQHLDLRDMKAGGTKI